MDITLEALREYEAKGLVHASRHPDLPLTVFCYTRTVQFERCWDDITRNARGLVVHDDGRIIGRGLPKFFAVGDPITQLPLDEEYMSFDKADGTLIHVVEYEGELLVWTKASFTTEHSVEARKYLQGWKPNPGTTTLFEGIFGFNRVVVDYGEFRGLVLLGEVENETGIDWKHPEDVAAETGWPGEVAVERSGLPLYDMIDLCADPDNGQGREGFVVVYPRDGAPAHRVKVKFVKYLALHKLMTGLTPRRVKETYLAALRDEAGGGDLWEEFLEKIPDEMDSAVQAVVNDLNIQAYTELLLAEAAVEKVQGLTTRREVAEVLSEVPGDIRSLAWLIYDHKDAQARLKALEAVEVSADPLLVLEEDS